MIENRFELKSVTLDAYLPQILASLFTSPAMFYEVYPQRVVNNIYFDDDLLSSYYENKEGLANRKKLRVRWYGKNLDSNLTAEVKSRIGNESSKVSENLNLIISDIDKVTISNFSDAFNKLKNQDIKNLYLLKSVPTIFTSYKRKYFQSKILNLRLTVDENLQFQSQIGSAKILTNNPIRDPHGRSIIEFKFPKESLKDVNKYISLNGLNRNRFSKYCVGIDSSYGV